MIDIAGAVPAILSRLKKLPTGQGLELLTYKRDRGLRIVRLADDRFAATEFGYHADTVQADLKAMKRVLKTVLKREFPRSRKVVLRPLPPDCARKP